MRRGRPEGGQGSDNIGGNPEGQIIVDHCSASWGMDENLSLYRYMKPTPGGPDVKMPTSNVTVQWCISSEALNAKNHAFGGTWGGHDSTFHHNLFACNTGRNPSIGMSGEFDYRNNVLFNWNHRTMDGGDETSLINVINNYYKPGPASNPDMRSTIARIEQRNMYSPGNRWEAGNWYPRTQGRPGKWYVAGNIIEGFPEVTANNWKGMRGPEELARVNTPFEGWPVNQQTALEALESVLAKAGATLPRRDAVDKRVTEMVRTGKVLTTDGIVSDPKEVGGYPQYAFTPDQVPADTDHDGFQDIYEGDCKFSNQFYRNNGNLTFTDIVEKYPSMKLETIRTKGVAFFDMDNDGDMDLAVANWEVGPRVYRNDQNDRSWIKVKAVGTTYADSGRKLRTSRDATGAKVRLYRDGKLVAYRQVLASNGFCSCPPLDVHFGADARYRYDIEVDFPSGIKVVRKNVTAGTAYTITEAE